jgi:tRNA-specific 2-thiouridylase
VTLGTREEVRGTKLSASKANWHCKPDCDEFDAIVQIRYNHRGAPARVKITGNTTFDVEFAEPVHAITPGQAAVIFDGDILLGGGWIE